MPLVLTAPPSNCQHGLPSALPRRSQSAMSSAPMAQMPRPRRPVMAEPIYIFSHRPSTSVGSLPISISFRPSPMMCVPGASIMARGDPGIGVGLADADQALVGVDLHDQIVLRGRAGIGAIVRHQQDEAFDLGDLHTAFLPVTSGGQVGARMQLFESEVAAQPKAALAFAPRRPFGLADACRPARGSARHRRSRRRRAWARRCRRLRRFVRRAARVPARRAAGCACRDERAARTPARAARSPSPRRRRARRHGRPASAPPPGRAR